MKIRHDFVSNSSSSSFVIVFEKNLDDMKSEEAVAYLRKLLFYDATHVNYNYSSNDALYMIHDHEYQPDEPTVFVTEELCFAILRELEEILSVEQLAGAFEGDDLWDPKDKAPEWPECDKDLPQEEREKIWEAHDKKQQEYALRQAKKFMDCFKGKYIYTGSFSDNDGEIGSHLEHGGVFNSVPHVRFSHH